MAKIRERAPRFLPEWVRQRIEVNVFHLFDFMEKAGAAHDADALVLDAGSGEGRFYQEFAHTRYIGIDLAVGDETWDYTKLDAVSELSALPFATGTFDSVLCTQVLEHVQEPYLVLAELCRVLKTGGCLYLSCPQSWHQHQKPHDYFRYTSFGLRYLLDKAGYDVSELTPMGGYFWYLSFQLQNMNYWVFPRDRRYRLLTLPFWLMGAFLFQLVLPLILFYLDPLDRAKDETFGYTCRAEKRSLDETLLASEKSEKENFVERQSVSG